MEQAIQEFFIGQRLWLPNSQNGLVTRAEFNPNTLQYQYFLAGVGGMFQQSDLSPFDPAQIPPDVPEPEPTPEPIVSPIGVTLAEVREIVGVSVAGLLITLDARLEALRIEREENVAEIVGAITQTIASLESRIVREQSEISNRLSAQDAIADESGEGGTPGFFRRITSFITSPFEAILEALEAYILGEVAAGLEDKN